MGSSLKIRTVFFSFMMVVVFGILVTSTRMQPSVLSMKENAPLSRELERRSDVLCNNLSNSAEFRLEVSFSLTLASFKINQNSFQTSSENYGLRMEFDASGVPALVYMPIEGKLAALTTYEPIRLNQETTVKILWKGANFLTFEVGDQVVTTPTLMFRQISCNSIMSGVGYDSSRNLDGKVVDFKWRIVSEEPVIRLSPITQGLLGILFGLSAYYVWYVRKLILK